MYLRDLILIGLIGDLAAFFSSSSGYPFIQMEITLRICGREERKSWKVLYDERSARLENIERRI